MKHRRFHPPAARPGRLPARREFIVHATLGVLWLSGVVWLVLHYWMREAGEFDELPHPLEPWMLRIHGAAAFVSLWLLGLLWTVHIVPSWRARRRISGIVLATLMLVLAITGWLIYYTGDETWRQLASISHWALGLTALVLLPVHALWHRRTRRSR